MNLQRYISNDLTHFVGRALVNDDDRYELLVKVIKSQKLSYPPHDGSSTAISLDLTKPVTADGLALPCIVCFCDIPLPDLNLHMKKYSQFGLSFSKTFLIEKGASPVFYVARDAASTLSSCITQPEYQERNESAIAANRIPRALEYDASTSATMKFMINLLWLANPTVMDPKEGEARDGSPSTAEKTLNQMGISSDLLKAATEELRHNPQFHASAELIFKYLAFNIFGFIKGFDSSLAEDDPDNYYMEREWRVVGSYVGFSMDNLQRVILPRRYAQRFRQDLPYYLGQVHFADAD